MALSDEKATQKLPSDYFIPTGHTWRWQRPNTQCSSIIQPWEGSECQSVPTAGEWPFLNFCIRRGGLEGEDPPFPQWGFWWAPGVSDGCLRALGGGMAGRKGTLDLGLQTLADGKCPLEEVVESTVLFRWVWAMGWNPLPGPSSSLELLTSLHLNTGGRWNHSKINILIVHKCC